ncbi:DegT/DnrJ/EryC1/StrS family aminotransferase (plasmid) [Salipiger sp. H15]|uniref:DegT/DnrJ/EryC1/StrS family aminotransferase n=1 Tax=Alloyangia sp. H15 TaxID=3029062 RepID=A0AAU8AQR1_9RHOB
MIPFLDLKRQNASISDELESAVLEVLRSGNYVLGEPVRRFEENFAAYCGTRHAVAVSSGTSALHLALLAAGIGPGDEVITVPATFVATVAAILYCGATPVLIDVDPLTLTMDPALLEPAITERTRAVIPVHFHGRLAEMAAIRRITEAHDLWLIEDAAQAHGARRDGNRAGGFGHMGCFSFYPGKNLGAAGEGGAVTTNDDRLAEQLRILRDWGQRERSQHEWLGYNYRMDAIQGAVLDVKLRQLEGWNSARREVARAYDEGLAPWVTRASPLAGEDHVYHVYAVRHPDREGLRKALAEAGIASNVHYPLPVHLQRGYAGRIKSGGSFPVAEAYAETTLSLPIFPELMPGEIAQVVAAVNAFPAPAQPEPPEARHIRSEVAR